VIGSLIILALAADTFGNSIDCHKDQYQLALNVCAARAYKRADDEMNRIWPMAIAAATKIDQSNKDSTSPRGAPRETAHDALLKAQRAFLIYREESCQVEYLEGFGGSIAPLYYSSCMERITTQRNKELRDIARVNDQ